MTTQDALNGSINKWTAIAAGHGINGGSLDCPLCEKYLDRGYGCPDCPIAAAGYPRCTNTEFREFLAYFDSNYDAKSGVPINKQPPEHRKELTRLALNELRFLMNLNNAKPEPEPEPTNEDGHTMQYLREAQHKGKGICFRHDDNTDYWSKTLFWNDKTRPGARVSFTHNDANRYALAELHLTKFYAPGMDFDTWAKAMIDKGLILRAAPNASSGTVKYADTFARGLCLVQIGREPGIDLNWGIIKSSSIYTWTAITKEQYEPEQPVSYKVDKTHNFIRATRNHFGIAVGTNLTKEDPELLQGLCDFMNARNKN